MVSYGRDAIWDAATWADIDQAVLDTASRVRVGRKIFNTETVDLTLSPWVSVAEVRGSGSDGQQQANEDAPSDACGGLEIPEGDAQPFIELSTSFFLTQTQLEAESSLRTARTLACFAAKRLSLAEDEVIFGGEVKTKGVVARTNAADRGIAYSSSASRELRNRIESRGGAQGDNPEVKPDDHSARATALLTDVNKGIAELASAAAPPPYALVLGANMYEAAGLRLGENSVETPSTLLAQRVPHSAVSAALSEDHGLIVSLAGCPVTIYQAHDLRTDFVGHVTRDCLPAYEFRLYERFQFALRDPGSLKTVAVKLMAQPKVDGESASARL